MGVQAPQYKFDGCVAAYNEGGVISLTSDVDPTDRLVWTQSDAEAAARVLRFLAPKLAASLRELASFARTRKYVDRDPETQG